MEEGNHFVGTSQVFDEESADSSPTVPETSNPNHLTSSASTSSQDQDSRIVLNVGGIRYETSLATLRKYPETLLGRMFSDDNLHVSRMTKPDKHGEFFIDRNGRFFECILDFYRTGIIVIPQDIPSIGLREEIGFFQLPVDERQIYAHNEMWGDRLSKIAMSRAIDNGRPIFDRILEHISNALNAAADRGCWKATIDICRTRTIVRTSGGIVKRDSPRVSVSALASFYPPTSEEQLTQQEAVISAPQWHYNLIDGAITRWLCTEDNLRLLEAHLTREKLNFTMKKEVSFFVMTFYLFDLSNPIQHSPAPSGMLSSSSFVNFGSPPD